MEDIITICQNLKLLRFKVYSSEPQKATLKVKGGKEAKGADFELPSQVELVNPKTHLATLTSKSASLEMEIQIEKGIGYVPVEQREKEKLAIGEIQLDAIFTPVRRVAFSIKNMRVGERTDFNRLKVEVETDGIIDPEEAFYKASEILVKHFDIVLEELAGTVKKEEKKASVKTSVDVKMEDLKLSGRTYNILLQNNVKTVNGLLKKKEGVLLGMKGMGKNGIKEIKKALKKLNLELK
jgi:DNA-directed RNA polymerase subunit alpha